MAIVFETAIGEDFDLGTGSVSKTAPGGGTINGTQVSVSTLGIGGAAGSASTVTWDPGSISAAQSVSTTITVDGAAVGDFVLVSHDSMGSNDLQLTAHVQSANTVRIVLSNPTAATIDIASGTLKVLVLRPK